MTSDILPVLLKCELLVTLTKEEINPIISLCHTEQYQPGETIFHQGGQGNKIYIIKEGQVYLERSVDLGDRKAQLIITTLGPGKALGSWLALLGESHCLMSSALCTRKTEVIAIEGPALREELRKNHTAGFKVMERLAYILREDRKSVV
jgi:CRP/FNR family cyclic AMP-dependent transcriptional regulator